MAETIGQAYIEIIPSADGISSKIEKEMSDAGSTSGVAFSAAFGGAAGVAMSKALSGVEAIGGAVMDFAKESVQTGNEFDAAMSQVAATAGKTMEQLNSEVVETDTAFGHFQGNLTDFAQFMGSNTAFSAKQAAEALNYMALAGYDAKTSVEMLPNVLSLAAAGAIDLGEASDMVTDVSSALNLSLDETATMVDQMAAAAASSNTSVAQLGAAMLKIGGTAANLKGGTQELSTALGILANNGIKSAEGGTHLRNMMLSITNIKTDAALTAMDRLGLSAQFAYDEMGNLRGMDEIFTDLNNAMSNLSNQDKDWILGAIFNKTDLSAARAMLAGMNITINDLNGALQNSGVNWDQYADKVWAAEGAIEGIAGNIAYDIAQGLSDAEIQDYLVNEYEINTEDAIAAINAAKSSVVSSESAWDSLYGKIGDAEGAAQQMADTQLDNLLGQLTLMDSALEGAKIAIAGEFTPALTDMVKLGQKGISDLTAAFQQGGFEGFLDKMSELVPKVGQMIIDKLPEFTEKGMQMIQALVEGAQQMTPYLTEAISKSMTIIFNSLGDFLPQLTSLISDTIVAVAKLTADNADQFADVVITILGAIGDGLIAAAPILLEAIPSLIETIITGFASNASAFVALIPTIVAALGPVILSAFNALSGIIGPAIQPFISSTIQPAISSALSSVGTSLSTALASAGTAITGVLSSLWAGLVTAVNEAMIALTADMGATFASGGAAALGTAATAIVGGIVAFFVGAEVGTKIGETLFPSDAQLYEQYEGITGTFDMLKDFFIALGDFFVMLWKDISAGAKEFFAAVVDFFVMGWEDISTWFTKALTGVSEFFTAIYDFFAMAWEKITMQFSEGIANAEELFNGFIENSLSWGVDLMANFIKGILSKFGDLKSTLTKLGELVKSLIGFSEPEKGPLSDFHTYAPDMMELFAKGIRDNETVVASQMQKSFNLGDAIVQNNIASEAAQSIAYESPVVANSDNSELSGQFAQAVELLKQLNEKDPVEIGASASGIFTLMRKENEIYKRANGIGAF